MPAPTIAEQLYPFSTEDSKAIPLDVIRPLSLIKKSIPAAGTVVLTIPVDWKLATFYSPEGCFIEFVTATIPNPPVDNTPYPTTLLVPPNCVVTSTVIAGAARVVSLSGVLGYVVAQQIQKWAGLALSRQASSIGS